VPGGIVSQPATRDRVPDIDDWGIVARVIGGGGFVIADQIRPANAVVTTVPQNAATVTLLANNVNRRGGFFWNSSMQPLYLKLGAGATLASFTVKLNWQAFYEIEWAPYTGIVTGIWSGAGGGFCQCTELT
jgi:hypothetical protein